MGILCKNTALFDTRKYLRPVSPLQNAPLNGPISLDGGSPVIRDHLNGRTSRRRVRSPRDIAPITLFRVPKTRNGWVSFDRIIVLERWYPLISGYPFEQLVHFDTSILINSIRHIGSSVVVGRAGPFLRSESKTIVRRLSKRRRKKVRDESLCFFSRSVIGVVWIFARTRFHLISLIENFNLSDRIDVQNGTYNSKWRK